MRVYLRNQAGGHRALAELLKSKDAIEQEIGQPLLWNPNPDAIDKTIAVYRDTDLRRRDKWPEYLDWMVDMTDRFRRVFGPRIRDLNLASLEDDEAAGN